MKSDIKEEFKEIDNLVLSKFYDSDHLTKPIEEGYTQFLEKYLKEYFSIHNRILMAQTIDKKNGVVTQYFLNIKKYFLEPAYHKGADRARLEVDSDLAMKYNLTRELVLNLEMNLTSLVKGAPLEEELILSKKRRAYEVGKIPLLINSTYDRFAKKTNLDLYYFMLNGSPRTLYNILEVNPMIKNLKVGLKDEVYCKFNADPMLNSKPLTLHVSKSKGVYVTSASIESKKLDFFVLLRLLDTPISKILQLKIPGLEQIDIITLIDPVYNKSKKQILDQFTSEFLNQEPLEDQELSEKLVADYLKNKFLCDLRVEEGWASFKQYELLKIFSETYKLYLDPTLEKYQDSLEYKRLVTVKDHFVKVFNQSFRDIIEKAKLILLRDIGLIKKTKSITHLIRSEIMKKAFKKYMCQLDIKTVEPHSEYLYYTNKLTLIAEQRKIVSNLNKTLLHAKFRSVNPSESGRICPVQTPSSRAVGLVKHLALGCRYSKEVPLSILSDVVDKLSLDTTLETSIYINDKLVGFSADNIDQLYQKFFKLKRKWHIGLTIKNKELYINISEGRLLKPVYAVEKQVPTICNLSIEELSSKSVSELVSKGYILYIDYSEELSSLIAPTLKDITKQTQFLHLNPGVYLSYLGSALPLIANNAAHRASLSIRLYDQAIGSMLDKNEFNYNQTKIQYLQKADPSLLATPFENNYIEHLGQNLIIAFSPGENEEDALEFNLSAIQRGLLNSLMYKRILKESLKNDDQAYSYQTNDKLEIPYTNLEKDHLPAIGSLVQNSVLSVLNEEKNMKQLTRVRSPSTPFYVNSLSLAQGLDKSCVIDFKLSKLRKLGIGDKLGTRNGLKGIVSKLTSELDAWIPESGVHPSLYLSNHVINSRMILGPLIELYLSKSTVLEGKKLIVPGFIDSEDLKNLMTKGRKTLEENGLDPEGYEYGHNQNNGVVKLNMGPAKVFLLEHHARDKMFLRTDKGGINFLTRQPSAGRSAQGGLRFGEMQINSAIESCATEFIKERLNVDCVKVKICKCGYIWDQVKEDLICKICNEQCQTTIVDLPYAFVVLTKILKAGHIGTKFKLKNQNLDLETPLDLNEPNLELDEDQENTKA